MDKRIKFTKEEKIAIVKRCLEGNAESLNDDYAKKLQEKHPQVNPSAFPKQKDTWYSLIIDDIT